MTYIAPEESAFGVGFFERLEANAKPMSLTQGQMHGMYSNPLSVMCPISSIHESVLLKALRISG